MIERLLSYNRAVYEALRSALRPGMREKDARRVIDEAYECAAGVPVPYIFDLVSGERTLEIGGEDTDRVLRAGDTVIVDLSPHLHGGWCDTTRTFFIGEPSRQSLRQYGALQETLARMEAFVRPGMKGREIYAAMSRCLTDRGFSPLAHHAGHCITAGDCCARPEFVEEEEREIREGMLIALEPGSYEETGIRIENNYRVTGDGIVSLFTYPLEPEYFIMKAPDGGLAAGRVDTP